MDIRTGCGVYSRSVFAFVDPASPCIHTLYMYNQIILSNLQHIPLPCATQLDIYCSLVAKRVHRRFYSNKYTDSEKQDAINLFLGNFVPRRGCPQLWELDSDQYLHADPWAIYNKRINASHNYTTGEV